MIIFLEHPITVLIGFLLIANFVQLIGPQTESTTKFPLVISLFALVIGLLSCLTFNKSSSTFQFLWRLDIVDRYPLTFGADGLSMVFLLLTLFIFPICILASWYVQRDAKYFFCHLLLMELLLVLTFTTTDLFYFYVFFESLLIPMFSMIGVWGARSRKIKAAYYFFLYTLFGSLFMLFGIFYLYCITGTTNFNVILNTFLEPEQQKIIWVCFFMAFAVKMPLFPFHIWLPEAHVEAPTVGSMLLASLLLKLGGYGFLRFSLSMLPDASLYYSPVVTTLSLLGVIYGSLSTIRQLDMKRVIAYSSVAHMNLVMLGLFSNNVQGVEGAIYLMIGHGVVSTALFFCVGVLYDRHHSRLFRYYGGLVARMPLFATFFFTFTLANMGFPGTSNFLGEILIFLGIFANNATVLVLSTAGIVGAAVYSIWLYNRICFGTLKASFVSRFYDITRYEFATLTSLFIPMIVLGITSDFILDFVHLPVERLFINF